MKNRSVRSWIIILLFIAANSIAYGQKEQLQNPIPESLPFPIMAWYGLTAEQLDIAHFRELADAGFTINFSDLRTPELNKKALALAQMVGIKLIINDNRIQPDKTVDMAALGKLDQVVRDYKDFPALLGYFIVDESSAANFENMAMIKKQFFLRDSIHIVYVNLLPDYAPDNQLGTKTYQEYIDKFVQVFQPQFLSYDYYPFLSTGFKDTYYQNLEVICETAIKTGIPFWVFTMSCQIYPSFPQPKESWIRLQLYSDLAYGAKGLQYFTYALPHSNTENFQTAILDSNGKPTYLYNIAKRVNSEIHFLETSIEQLHSIAVFHTEPLPKGTQPLPEDFYIKNIKGGSMVVGYFKDNTECPYLLLVNRDYEKNVNFTISVPSKVKGFMEVSKFNKKESTVFEPEKGKIELQFKDGDGRLFRILY
jgi:hypothetical protein